MTTTQPLDLDELERLQDLSNNPDAAVREAARPWFFHALRKAAPELIIRARRAAQLETELANIKTQPKDHADAE